MVGNQNEATCLQSQSETLNYIHGDTCEVSLPAQRRKIEDLESENKNLRAAARTLQEDIDKDREGNQKFAKVTKRGGIASATPDAPISYESNNQYEVLSISDLEEDAHISLSDPVLSAGQPEVRQHKDTVRGTNTTPQVGKTSAPEAGPSKDKAENTIPEDGKSKPNILLIGDSMIKDINGPHKLSKSSVRKLTFPGKRAEEIRRKTKFHQFMYNIRSLQ